MEEIYFKKVMTTIILAILVVLSFFLIKPILLSIIIGLILAFVFTPIYNWFYAKTHSPNLSAMIICIVLILLVILPFWFLTPILVEQSLKVYMASQQIDFVNVLKTIFPSLFSSEAFSREIGSILSSFTTKATNSLVNSLSELILNFPTLSLQILVALFTFFYILRDKEILLEYIKSLLPFQKDIEKRLFESSKAITISVIYGQVIIGLIQGIIVGVGFFVFGVSNALILTMLACLAGIFPVVGTTIVWVPIFIYLIIAGNTFSGFGVLAFGLVSGVVDNFIRPFIVSRRSRMHNELILIGMIGGLFFFGILGFILGPLIIAYLLIVLEIYRNKKSPGIFIETHGEIK